MASDRLERLQRRVWGARTVALVTAGGEPVRVHGGEEDGDTEALARLLVEQWRAAESEPDPLAGGDLRLFVVETDRYRILLGAVSESQCLMLIVGAAGNEGQARFELRRAIQELQQESDRLAE